MVIMFPLYFDFRKVRILFVQFCIKFCICKNLDKHFKKFMKKYFFIGAFEIDFVKPEAVELRLQRPIFVISFNIAWQMMEAISEIIIV